MSLFKGWLKNIGKNNYSKDKIYLNAIVIADSNFTLESISKMRTIKILTYIYAAIVFFLTAISIGMLGISESYQQNNKTLFSIIEIVVFIVLTIDVILRWYTSEVRIKKGNWSYFLFPFTLVGAMMIASLLPSLYLINVWSGDDFQIFNTFENMKFLRIFRLILLANLVPSLGIFTRVLKKEKSTLYVVFTIVLITILVFALVMYNVEGIDSPQAHEKVLKEYNISNGTKFTEDEIFNSSSNTIDIKIIYEIQSMIKIHSFLDSLYFSTVALTTIGFGDISPITDIGRIITIVMSVIGIAVLATPSGVIAGGFITEIKEQNKEKAKSKK